MFPPLCASNSCLVLPRSGNCGGFGSRPLSQPLDDVGCDITDADKLALGFPQPWLTPEGFITPSPGSPASFSFQMIENAHSKHSISSTSRKREHKGVSFAWVQNLVPNS
jgi:hypothetical protein